MGRPRRVPRGPPRGHPGAPLTPVTPDRALDDVTIKVRRAAGQPPLPLVDTVTEETYTTDVAVYDVATAAEGPRPPRIRR